MNDNKKKSRQIKLAKIIGSKKINDQNQLLEEIKKDGIKATQATISRDLNEMGVIKVRLDSKNYVFQIADKIGNDIVMKKLGVLFLNFVVEIHGVQNQLIIKTSPGNAHGVASFIDRLDWSEIIGTIAGDDTILVILNNQKNRVNVELKFQKLLDCSSD